MTVRMVVARRQQPLRESSDLQADIAEVGTFPDCHVGDARAA